MTPPRPLPLLVLALATSQGTRVYLAAAAEVAPPPKPALNAPPPRPGAAPTPRLGSAARPEPGAPLFRNISLPIAARTADLLARMTLQEKVAQLQAVNWEHTRLFDESTRLFSPEQARTLISHGIGEITRPSDKRDAAQATAFANAIQKYLVEQTSLGIPALMHEEGLHGFVAPAATSFPQAIALGATFDPALVEAVFTATARQMRARGVQHALAPVLDVARDPRWGRFEETYGEDPYLVSRMGVAAVRGFQGRRAAGAPIDAVHVLATGKHFAVHGQPEGGRNTAPGNLSERLIREVFFPPFETAIHEAGLATIMASYNEIDGIPSHANHWLLGGVLRGEWKFGGLVVGDYFGVAELERKHHVVADLRTAGRTALDAGVDLELPQPEGYVTLASDVKAGVLAESVIDRAVTRVLETKMMLGLFERPYADPAAAVAPERAADRLLAQRAAEEAMVLLKNTGGLLPLDAARIKSIAVIGPNAAVCRLGGYSGTPTRTVSIVDGIRSRVGNKVKVSTAPGCGLTTGGRGWMDDEVTLPTAAEDALLMAAALKAAADAEVVVLVLGQNEQLSREGWADNHRGDRMTLRLVGSQYDLARAVLATGKPTILLLSNGSPLILGPLAHDVPAIIEGFYLGEETGTAVARVLFGDVSPSGKLPMTMPRETGSLPAYYNYKPSGRRLYLFEEPGPAWPFGYGLAYTTFKYSNVTVTPSRVPPSGKATVTVTITNTGKRAADEVAQLYVHDLVSSVTRPVQELKGFRRVHLGAGQSARVQFPLGAAELSFLDQHMQRVVEPGTFDVMVGGNSVDVAHARLDVTQ